ncbi:MAG TPA: nuclear transport factor 2 family protein [Pyrinomonadaceae bacterium]|nr:nuclear transport factor 2 family protein [Pyrinomonadaceae bacterium]
MKIFILAVLLIVGAPMIVLCQKKQSDKMVNELMHLERDWVAASLKRDRTWLKSFFADEFVSTHPTSWTIKNTAREIADTKEEEQTPDSSTLGDMKVIVAGKTAIITGTAFEVGGVHKLTDRNRGLSFYRHFYPLRRQTAASRLAFFEGSREVKLTRRNAAKEENFVIEKVEHKEKAGGRQLLNAELCANV